MSDKLFFNEINMVHCFLFYENNKERITPEGVLFPFGDKL